MMTSDHKQSTGKYTNVKLKVIKTRKRTRCDKNIYNALVLFEQSKKHWLYISMSYKLLNRYHFFSWICKWKLPELYLIILEDIFNISLFPIETTERRTAQLVSFTTIFFYTCQYNSFKTCKSLCFTCFMLIVGYFIP